MSERNTRILLVEDEEAHAKLVCRAFASADESCRLTVANCLQQARALLSTPPDLLITDFLLPDGRGTELLPRDGEPTAYPVLILTSQGSERTAVEAMKAGALDYVVKTQETLAAMPQIAQRALREWRHLTELKRLEEQCRQMQRMEAVGRLAGGVAHDFNNLLTVITGYSELLLDSLKPHDRSRELLREIHKAGERAAALTRQLLAFSRKLVLQPQVLDLNTLVTGMVCMLRRLIGEHIHLEKALDPALGAIKADPGQIEQVIVNLVVNARDAMPDGGRLTLATRNVELGEVYVRQHAYVQPGPYVLVVVGDTGCGMDEATRARVFEPFFTTKGVGKGTGLGLATAYGIVKQSGGSIEVESAPGRGTTFHIYLPRHEGIAPTRKSHPGLRQMPRGTETVLLAEDEEGVRSLGRQILQMAGYQVLAARDGAEALRLSDRHPGPIHLLATDVVMPGLNGCELARRLAPRRPGLKVLYLSGYTDDLIASHGVLESGLAFLQKPFGPATLAQKVREVLDQEASTEPTDACLTGCP